MSNTFNSLPREERLRCYATIARRTGMYDLKPLHPSTVSRILRGVAGYTVNTGSRSLPRIAAAALVDEDWLKRYIDKIVRTRLTTLDDCMCQELGCELSICRGECGCETCHNAYGDFLSSR